ncbi:MAG: hypothetical protein JWN49_88 [Parcubacteria group bacterium]|nr:hypothetical protein [Parcubacteria group bacterium]
MAIITTIGLRHGNAHPARHKTRRGDLIRDLSNEGIQQVLRRRPVLESFTFDREFSSIAQRAIQTAQRATMRPLDRYILLKELYTPEGPDGAIIDTIFDEVGNAAPSAYLTHPLNLRHQVGWNDSPVGRIGTRAGCALAGYLAGRTDQTIFVAAHGLYIQLAVKGLGETLVGANEELGAFLDDLDLTEAGMFRVTFNTCDPALTTFELYP